MAGVVRARIFFTGKNQREVRQRDDHPVSSMYVCTYVYEHIYFLLRGPRVRQGEVYRMGFVHGKRRIHMYIIYTSYKFRRCVNYK